MRFLLFASIALLLASQSFAEFYANYDAVAGRIWVLCDNRSEVFVSGQGMQAQEIWLDENSQAGFAPQAGGKYVAQCGNLTREVNVPLTAQPPSPVKESDFAMALAAGAVFLLFSLLLSFFAMRVLFSQAWFCKSVVGNRAKITLHAGAGMKNIVIRDKAGGFAGGEKVFVIPRLERGGEWQAEYDINGQESALPAGLEAEYGGKRMIMQSQLIVDSTFNKPSETPGNDAPQAGRKVPKAEDGSGG